MFRNRNPLAYCHLEDTEQEAGGRALQVKCERRESYFSKHANTISVFLFNLNFSFDRRFKVHSDGTLSVQAVTEKDAGDYLCITRNRVADDYRLLRVSVATKPAKIEGRRPLNHLVSLGRTLKVGSHFSALFSNNDVCPSKISQYFSVSPFVKTFKCHMYLFCNSNSCLVCFIVGCAFKSFSSFELCHFHLCFFYSEGI